VLLPRLRRPLPDLPPELELLPVRDLRAALKLALPGARDAVQSG